MPLVTPLANRGIKFVQISIYVKSSFGIGKDACVGLVVSRDNIGASYSRLSRRPFFLSHRIVHLAQSTRYILS